MKHLELNIEKLNLKRFSELMLLFSKKEISKLELDTNALAILTNSTIEDVEEWDFQNEFKVLRNKLNELNFESILQLEPLKEFVCNGVTYKASLTDNGDLNLKLKEVKFLRDKLSNNENDFYKNICLMAAVLFKDEDEQKFDETFIQIKADIFNQNMTAEYFFPYSKKFIELLS